MVVKRKRAAGGADKKKVGKSGRNAATAGRRAREDALAEAEGEMHSDDEDSDFEGAAGKSDEEDEFFETPDEKRVRLAKEYLSKLGDGKAPEKVQEQLAKDVEEHERRNRIQVQDLEFGEQRFLKGHKQATTCVCLSSDEGTMYSGGKDCAVIRWDVETGKKDVFPGGRNRFECGGHFEKVLSICLLEQRGLLASAGVDRVVRLWDPRAARGSSCIAKLSGHTAAITALQPEFGEEQLYSASLDKSLKIWDLSTRRCTETLLGHVSGVSSLDLFQKSRPLSGGSDKTVRFWKVDKDTHLMFTRHTYAVDAVCVADQDRFISGSQDGSIMLWSSGSKKPLATTSLGDGRWVASLSAIKQGNVFFSGSVDGTLRAWRFGRGAEDTKGVQLSEAAEPVIAPGCINQIAVGKRLLACAVGKEHKFGRWFYNKKERNGVLLVPISYKEG
eukprot:TRINITY_DN65834_c0_g1_i1.p1 TRINITY_DN65834_c0_g1~~TRINITY_DN65834_c0_g1_i1.p1  ORF type:complete len:454 (+),score=93.32 TRINITY_DN65834_c0_g1_i1:33-1364(+)